MLNDKMEMFLYKHTPSVDISSDILMSTSLRHASTLERPFPVPEHLREVNHSSSHSSVRINHELSRFLDLVNSMRTSLDTLYYGPTAKFIFLSYKTSVPNK